MIRVIVYDDNLSRLEGLKMCVNQNKDMECVGTFENCLHVIKEVGDLKPDVVLMDIDMPEVDGIKGLRMIRKHYPQVMVVMQTVMEEDTKIFEAICNGAHGYFLKRTDPERLIDGIRNVLEGGAPMTDTVARQVLELFKKQSGHESNDTFDLTERELDILRLLVKGLSYKMVASACGITYHTVNWHCKKIYEKLHVHSATEAVAKALHRKIV
jgi:DNA-binding NarL/FixJ family response regulator